MKLRDILREYEKGELSSISDKATSNIDKEAPVKVEKTNVKSPKPIGTNYNVIDTAAKTIGSGAKSLAGSPKKMSDFVMQMRAQIPDFDDLIQKNPRFIRGVRNISNDAANRLMKISKDTSGRK